MCQRRTAFHEDVDEAALAALSRCRQEPAATLRTPDVRLTVCFKLEFLWATGGT